MTEIAGIFFALMMLICIGIPLFMLGRIVFFEIGQWWEDRPRD